MRYLLLVPVFLGLSLSNAFAWGDTAHRVICEVASQLAKPATQAEIQRLIDSDPAVTFPDFSESCIFPDHPRIRPTEHFINLPRSAVGLISDKCPLAQDCVLTAIRSDLAIVSSKSETDARRLIALESLGHWVGDIHQPMHVSFEDDRGGNKINVTGCGKNLHAVWDKCLVEDTVGLDIRKAAANLMAEINPAVRSQWINSSPRDWANESFAIARAVTTRYCVMHDQSCDLPTDQPITITTDYIEANKPVVRQQLQKAAVRLAHLLDEAFGN